MHHGFVDPLVVQHWGDVVGKQLICQAELMAFAIVRVHYEALLTNRSCIAFIDNEAARFALIKGASPSTTMFDLVDYLALVGSRSPCAVWFERVCTHSNLADLPSRGRAEEAAVIVAGANKGDIQMGTGLKNAALGEHCCFEERG